MSDLVPSAEHGKTIDELRGRLTTLERTCVDRAEELDRVKSELASFRIAYRRDVGTLHDELDDLERAIAELELGEISRLLDEGGGSQEPAPTSDRAAAPRFTSDAMRKLFRDVAKMVHPDLARDQQARDRRHALMVEANRAYAAGDEERLRRILEAWERSPEAVDGDDADAMRSRVLRRIAQLEEQLAAFDSELAELRDTPLYQLKAMVDAAAAGGKDLVADMVRRLKRDIMRARNRLDAMRWTP